MAGDQGRSLRNLRAQCPVRDRWAFFDHAAVAPLTRPAHRAFVDYADDLLANGDVNERRWVHRVEDVRHLFARLLNAHPMDVAFVKNTSEGIGFVAEGWPWQSGDNVVIAEEEYPANVYPWLNLHDRGVEVRRWQTRDRRLWIDDLALLLDARTRIVSVSFVEYATGFRNDVDAIGALCRERGVAFFLDAIQGLGVLPLDVARTPVDFLAADGHKWLLGPEGAGVFWVRREMLDRLRPLGVGWNSVVGARDFATIDFRLKQHAGRYEGGTLNVAGISALGASLQLLLDVGIDQVRARVLELTDFLCERLSALNWEVFSSRQPQDCSGIVSVTTSEPPRAVVQRCRQAGIVVNHRAGRLRVSPHAYNVEAEVERLVEALGGA